MLWLEMSRDQAHGGGSWSFSHCLWAPTHKQNDAGRWPYWDNLLRVKAGDLILHLRDHRDKQGSFVGYSNAEIDGFKTTDRPPVPGQWAYARSFYRVLLRDFTEFPTPISLKKIFQEQEAALRSYIERNKNKAENQQKRIFYVVQAGRLQRLNGAYLSEADDELTEILLGISLSEEINSPSHPGFIDIKTGERLAQLQARIGQSKFSDQVRENYEHRCCFPNCTVADDQFLVGSHIARWADVPSLRGHIDNGLCFCLMHDKAFELGLFTIDRNLCIRIHYNRVTMKGSQWSQSNLLPYDSHPIQRGRTLPSEKALLHHWERIGIDI